MSDFWENRRIAHSLGYKKTSDYLGGKVITIAGNPGAGMTYLSNFFETQEDSK